MGASNENGNPFNMFRQFDNGFPGFGNVFVFGNQFGMQPPSRGLSAEQVANLKEKPADKKTDCYICLDQCKDGKESAMLPCGHAFCRVCIEGWVKEHDTCPVCRKKILEDQSAQPQPYMH